MIATLITALPGVQTFAAACSKPTFFGLVPWYQYLKLDSSCNVTSFNDPNSIIGPQSGLLLVGLAILDDLIRVAALVAVGYIIYGGIQYVTSQGSPDATSKAQQTIINALIGVVVAVVASGLVTFIGTKIGG